MKTSSIPTASAINIEEDDVEIGRSDNNAMLLPPDAVSSSAPENTEFNEAITEKLKFPYFTAMMITTNIVVYCYGLFFIIGIENTEISKFSPISPPNDSMEFSAVGNWPGEIYLHDFTLLLLPTIRRSVLTFLRFAF
jgi:hypothetical protein